MRCLLPVLLTLSALPLAGCDMLGIESADQVALRREAESKAIGGACRHAGRPIEDCYSMNKKADKAAVFAGWREMNDYMRENKMQSVAPTATDEDHENVLPKAVPESSSDGPAATDKPKGRRTANAEKRPAAS